MSERGVDLAASAPPRRPAPYGLMGTTTGLEPRQQQAQDEVAVVVRSPGTPMRVPSSDASVARLASTTTGP